MNRVDRIASVLPLTAVFFAASFVLNLYAHNIGELTLKVLGLPLITVIILFLAVSLVAARVWGVRLGNVFSAIASLLFFTYGDAYSILTSNLHLLPDSVFSAHGLAITWLVILAMFPYVLRRHRPLLPRFNLFLFVTAGISMLLPLLQIGSYEAFSRVRHQDVSPLTLPKSGITKAEAENLPDIYYIIPDSYAGPEALKKYFRYDDGDFVSALQSRGFYVATESASNYPKTYLSVASSLNMEYLDYLSDHTNSTDQSIITPLIWNNNVVKFLKSQGYKYYHIGSWWNATQYNPNADKNYNLEFKNPLGINTFTYMVIGSSIAKPFFSDIFPKAVIGDSVEDKRDRILYQLRTLPEVSKLKGPKFVLAHIIAPHGPNVFGGDCESIRQEDLYGKPDDLSYDNQVACINKKLLDTIDAIRKNSKQQPVIIIQADEGAAFLGNQLNPPDTWKNASDLMLKKKFPILAAYSLPGSNPAPLYPGITPVNEFRIVLNRYFGTDLPLVPDRNFIPLDTEHIYEFRDVTSIVRDDSR